VSERRRTGPLPLGARDGLPFSKGLLARALMLTGLAADRAYELARRAELDLGERGVSELDLGRLEELATGLFGDAERQALIRLRRWQVLHELDLPIVLLVGGATGTGKSTIATEAAHRLGIVRVTSTDFIRHTMRAFFSKTFMPSVHYSSFEARLALTKAEEEEAGDPTILGFLDQTRNVLVGVEAAVERALTEGFSMVLEGVHLVPGMLRTDFGSAVVVHCVLAIEDEAVHRSHFWIRDAASEGERPLDKYIEGFPEIRLIQDTIVERARRYDVPVIENRSVDQSVAAILELVLDRVEAAASLR
jgi:2-phosphoglycerate kinase